MRSNPIRFTGMASGMDTDSIVRDLLRPQQFKIDNQKKARALLQLKQDAWKDMNKKLYDFHTKFTHQMSQASTFNKNITTSSNTNAININNMATVPQGTHQFEIGNLATSTSVTGTIAKLAGDKTVDATTTVGDLIELGAGEETTLTMKVNGKDEPVTVKVTAGDTLSNVAAKMNKELKGEGFTARYDEANGKFFVNSTKTGKDATIAFESGAGNDLFDKLGLTDSSALKQGVDANYKYNGADFTSASNSIEVNGIKATLKAATSVDGVITISSARDTEAIYTWVKEFVTEYNKLLDDINGKIGAKPGKDIAPLTADERAAMSESEIKLWEEKLNSSLFYKDEQLTGFANTARNVLGDVHGQSYAGKRVDGERQYGEDLVYQSLASLGIETGPWQERGKLHINGDEDDSLYSGLSNKLREAIEANPDDVIEFFTTLGSKLYEEHNDKMRSSNDLKSAMNFYNDKVMVDQAKEQEKRIFTLEERLYAMEQMHYAKFAAMEKMLSALNNQSSWLSQQFGG